MSREGRRRWSKQDGPRPVTATAYEECLHFLERAEQATEVVAEEWHRDRPNSSRARHYGQYGAHCRKMAEIHAHLAVAEEIHALRDLFGSLEQHGQAFIA